MALGVKNALNVNLIKQFSLKNIFPKYLQGPKVGRVHQFSENVNMRSQRRTAIKLWSSNRQGFANGFCN